MEINSRNTRVREFAEPVKVDVGVGGDWLEAH